MIKVLILVMSAKRQPWGKLMDCSLATWDAEDHPQTQTLYYCGKSDQPSTDKVFYSPNLTEDLCDVSSRTIEAFEKSLELEWDFLARPNSSCYVHKKNLVAFCETLPRENAICGILSEGERPFLWGGCQYVFSRDVIERMVEHKDKWNHGLMDDNSITEMVRELSIPLKSEGRCASINVMPDGSYLCLTYGYGESFTFIDFADIRKAEGHFFLRVKHDPDRSVDIKIMKALKTFLP